MILLNNEILDFKNRIKNFTTIFFLWEIDLFIWKIIINLQGTTNLSERTFSTYEFYQAHQENLTPAGLAFFQSDWDSSLRDFFHNTLIMKVS